MTDEEKTIKWCGPTWSCSVCVDAEQVDNYHQRLTCTHCNSRITVEGIGLLNHSTQEYDWFHYSCFVHQVFKLEYFTAFYETRVTDMGGIFVNVGPDAL